MKTLIPLEKKFLALALIQALRMWSNERYAAFLHCDQPGDLDKDWFKWFRAEWKVARTIKKEKQDSVRHYLNTEFRAALKNGRRAEAVYKAALHIQSQKWSTNGALPISIVSKTGFFLCPCDLAPFDNYAKTSLQKIRADKGIRMPQKPSYQEYLEAFNEEFRQTDVRLKRALKQAWVISLARELGCPADALSSIAMRRKLFDDYLMYAAGY